MLNTFFVEIVPNLGTKVDERYLCNASNISDPIEKLIQKYKNEPSISIIKKTVSTFDKNNKFSLQSIIEDDISQQIKGSDINNTTQESDIRTKLVKHFDNFIVDFLQETFNNFLKKGTFPEDFKKVVVHPTYKKDCKTKKSNYRLISVFPNLFKIHERLLQDQRYTYSSNFYPQYRCGFCKGYIAQHYRLVMTEKMKEARDNSKVCAAVLTDLSKAFDCLLHDLLIAKLHAFGFDHKFL